MHATLATPEPMKNRTDTSIVNVFEKIYVSHTKTPTLGQRRGSPTSLLSQHKGHRLAWQLVPPGESSAATQSTAAAPLRSFLKNIKGTDWRGHWYHQESSAATQSTMVFERGRITSLSPSYVESLWRHYGINSLCKRGSR
jgi:hypothetical protein